MRGADLIVCERRDRITPALKFSLERRGVSSAELSGRRTWLRQRSGVRAMSRLLDDAPASVVVLETYAENLAEVLTLLATLPRRWPGARGVAVVDEKTTSCRAGLREAGAIHVVQELLELDAVAELALKHFARQKQPERNWRDEIWDTLPWGA